MKSEQKRLPPNSLGICKIEGCGKNAVAFHLCSAHYSKLKKYGDPSVGRTNDGSAKLKVRLLRQKKQKAKCRIEGCSDHAHGHGLCDFHCTRFRKHGDPLGGGPKRILDGASSGACAVDGCSNEAMARHLCAKHYSSLRKFGDPLGAKPQDGRSKVWHIRKGGYVVKFDRSNPYTHPISGIVFQHRQVMGEMIGRPLRENESVHHKNGDRSDNRRSNLELWSRGQPAGQRVEDQVKWAREILKEYGALFK
jgi:hypothetical protein